MPFESKRQARKCYAMKNRNEAGSWDCDEWSENTDFDEIPEKASFSLGQKAAELFDSDSINAAYDMVGSPLVGGVQGVVPGAAIGGIYGGTQGKPVEGIGRGVVRGVGTGAGAGAGLAAGSLASNLTTDPRLAALITLLGGAAGGTAGWLGSGALLGEGYQDKQSFDLGAAASELLNFKEGMFGAPAGPQTFTPPTTPAIQRPTSTTVKPNAPGIAPAVQPEPTVAPKATGQTAGMKVAYDTPESSGHYGAPGTIGSIGQSQTPPMPTTPETSGHYGGVGTVPGITNDYMPGPWRGQQTLDELLGQAAGAGMSEGQQRQIERDLRHLLKDRDYYPFQAEEMIQPRIDLAANLADQAAQGREASPWHAQNQPEFGDMSEIANLGAGTAAPSVGGDGADLGADPGTGVPEPRVSAAGLGGNLGKMWEGLGPVGQGAAIGGGGLLGGYLLANHLANRDEEQQAPAGYPMGPHPMMMGGGSGGGRSAFFF